MNMIMVTTYLRLNKIHILSLCQDIGYNNSKNCILSLNKVVRYSLKATMLVQNLVLTLREQNQDFIRHTLNKKDLIKGVMKIVMKKRKEKEYFKTI